MLSRDFGISILIKIYQCSPLKILQNRRENAEKNPYLIIVLD